MKNLLFNTHDIALAACILFSVFFAFAHNFSRIFSQSARNVLTVFFVLNACAALDTLVFWGDGFKFAAFAVSPWLLLLFSFASFAAGPFLYWFFRSIQNPAFTLRARDYLHLLPALAVFPYVYWACLRYPLEQQQTLILQLSILTDERAHFWIFLTIKKLLPVMYGVLGLALLRSKELHSYSPALRHFILVHGGFVLLWAWSLATHILGQWAPVELSDHLGIVGNYLTLALLIVLWLERARLPIPAVGSENPPGVQIQAPAQMAITSSIESTADDTQEKQADLDALALQIQAFVQTERPYLNPQLTLERFAAQLQMPTRQVSNAINRCFKQNFQEYINSYRVETAKHFLHDSQCHLTIVDIAHHAGFNSKATFNRLFKIQVGVTPSEYRQGVTNGHPSSVY